jgi:hypothetical protein
MNCITGLANKEVGRHEAEGGDKVRASIVEYLQRLSRRMLTPSRMREDTQGIGQCQPRGRSASLVLVEEAGGLCERGCESLIAWLCPRVNETAKRQGSCCLVACSFLAQLIGELICNPFVGS